MPIYEYRCTSCGAVTEALQKMSDSPLTTCGTCSGALEKLVSRTSFQLAGGGWFKSGYTNAGGTKTDSDGQEKKATEGGASSDDKKPKGGCGAGCGCH